MLVDDLLFPLHRCPPQGILCSEQKILSIHFITMQSSNSPQPHSVYTTLKRIVLRPVFWTRNLRGYILSCGFSNPNLAKKGLGKINERWRKKIYTVIASPDNKHIPRVSEAGSLEAGLLTMHNGLKVGARSYYGDGYLNLLIANKGVHEPQEERAFAEILKLLKPSATMLELGSYWAFYSMWFSKEVRNPTCHMVEPDFACLLSGKNNFKRQGFNGKFSQAYIAEKPSVSKDGTDVISVDSYCATHGIEKLEILHSDIQGAEMAMLAGASRMLSARKIDYVFISTHSNELHYGCIAALKAIDYTILASADMDDTYSGDGLIVAKGPHIEVPVILDISLRTKHANAS